MMTVPGADAVVDVVDCDCDVEVLRPQDRLDRGREGAQRCVAAGERILDNVDIRWIQGDDLVRSYVRSVVVDVVEWLSRQPDGHRGGRKVLVDGTWYPGELRRWWDRDGVRLMNVSRRTAPGVTRLSTVPASRVRKVGCRRSAQIRTPGWRPVGLDSEFEESQPVCTRHDRASAVAGVAAREIGVNGVPA